MLTLLYSDVDGHERSHEIGPEPVVVGRSAECAIRSEDARVSRHHARFYFEQGALWVEDLGSANGVYLGPNKVQRAIVPAAEIIIVGSLVLRLVPSSGTMPPPLGVHGTLAQWLSIERKARAKLEEERNAFALRVGEMHRQMAHQQAPEAQRQHEQALAQAMAERDAALERIATLEGELSDHAEWSSAVEGEQAKVMEELTRLRREAAAAHEGRVAGERAATVERDDSERMREQYEESAAQVAAELDALRGALLVLLATRCAPSSPPPKIGWRWPTRAPAWSSPSAWRRRIVGWRAWSSSSSRRAPGPRPSSPRAKGASSSRT
jgi:hypothetical protein